MQRNLVAALLVLTLASCSQHNQHAPEPQEAQTCPESALPPDQGVETAANEVETAAKVESAASEGESAASEVETDASEEVSATRTKGRPRTPEEEARIARKLAMAMR